MKIGNCWKLLFLDSNWENINCRNEMNSETSEELSAWVGPHVSERLCRAKPEATNPIYIGWGEEMYQYDKNSSKRLGNSFFISLRKLIHCHSNLPYFILHYVTIPCACACAYACAWAKRKRECEWSSWSVRFK